MTDDDLNGSINGASLSTDRRGMTRLDKLRSDVERMVALSKSPGLDQAVAGMQSLLEDLCSRLKSTPADSHQAASRIENEFLANVQTDLSFRRLYTASAALRSIAMLGAQVNRLDELSESGGLPDDQLAMYVQFYGIMVSLVNDTSDDLRALSIGH